MDPPIGVVYILSLYIYIYIYIYAHVTLYGFYLHIQAVLQRICSIPNVFLSLLLPLVHLLVT